MIDHSELNYLCMWYNLMCPLIYIFLSFLGLLPWHMEIPRLEV